MRTKITITVRAITSDPELEKVIYLAAEEGNLYKILDLLKYCETSEADFHVAETLQRKLITTNEH